MGLQETKSTGSSNSQIFRARSLSGSIKKFFKASTPNNNDNGIQTPIHSNDQVEHNPLSRLTESKKAELQSSRRGSINTQTARYSREQDTNQKESSPKIQQNISRENSVTRSSIYNTSARSSNERSLDSSSITHKHERANEFVDHDSFQSRSELSRKPNRDSLDSTRNIDSVLFPSSGHNTASGKPNNDHTASPVKDKSSLSRNGSVVSREIGASISSGKSITRNNSFKIPSLFKSNIGSVNNNYQSAMLSDDSKSNTLSRVHSTPSSQNSTNSQQQQHQQHQQQQQHRTRPHADTISAGSLSSKEIRYKCILQAENFKVFENGSHEHNLKLMPIIRPYIDEGDTGSSDKDIQDNMKQRSVFSLSNMFKSHKNDENLNNIHSDVAVDKAFEEAFSLIPSVNSKLKERGEHSTSDQSLSLSDSNLNNDPNFNSISNKVVNPLAAIGTDELKLINKLSERINDGITGKGHNNCTELTQNKVTFSENYGKSVGVVLGNGSYGIVRLFAKVRSELDPLDPSSMLSYYDNKKIFFAVKELKPKTNEPSSKFTTRITSEFIIGHSLSHIMNSKSASRCSPNIVKVLDLMEVSNGSFIEVLEFCPAGDLYSILIAKSKSGTALHPLEADCFMKQLLTGISFMHSHGVAHCDLKPENILFHPNGLLKICDFGTSCVFQTAWEKTVHFQNDVVGSEPYVAPEEFIHNNEYDPRLVDSWSIGIIYCSMVLGHYLWKVAIQEKDSLFKSFCTEMADTNEFYIFEEMRHVNHEINRLRKATLYKIIQTNPSKRVTVDQVLASAWMRNTNCCIRYKRSM